MADDTTVIAELRARVANFVRTREWETYHNPKDLAIALSVEASELLELFEWKRPEEIDIQDAAWRASLEEELADVFIYTLHLANAIGCDLSEAAIRKIAKNAEKYPAEKYRRRARTGA